MVTLYDYFRLQRLPFAYRQEPVPGTGRQKKKRLAKSKIYRRPRTANERRQNSDKDLQMFIRSKRQPHALADTYDDIFRKSQRSWKENGKRRRQWE